MNLKEVEKMELMIDSKYAIALAKHPVVHDKVNTLRHVSIFLGIK